MYVLEVRIETYFDHACKWENSTIEMKLSDEVGQQLQKDWHSNTEFDQCRSMIGAWLALNQRGYVILKDQDGNACGGYDGVGCDIERQRNSLAVFRGGRTDASPVREAAKRVTVDIVTVTAGMKFPAYGDSKCEGVYRMEEVPVPDNGDELYPSALMRYEGIVSKDWVTRNRKRSGIKLTVFDMGTDNL